MCRLKYIPIQNYTTYSGKRLSINLSYQLFGKPLHSAPIIMVNHALTGNSNVAGPKGWWKDLIGSGKCIDTKRYSIIAFNVPGNGYGLEHQGLVDNYKQLRARDVAELFAIGLKKLQIQKLFAVIGGSVGGGIAWELAALKPSLIQHLIPIATDWKSTDWLVAHCHVQDAILNHSSQPLADARMHAMTLYRSPESLSYKFKRSYHNPSLFEIESWLNYHGQKLTERFQIGAYKLMNQILRTIDITFNRGLFLDVASAISSDIHIITINSDLFFKPEENWTTFVDLKSVKDNVTINEIKSIHGHDAFLIEFHQLQRFLKPIFSSDSIAKVEIPHFIKSI